jgi:hypothetical protein
MCRGELRILLTSIFGANKPYFLAGGHYVFVSREESFSTQHDGGKPKEVNRESPQIERER